MQLSWAQSVAERTRGRVLILTPLAVAGQTVKEGERFGFSVGRPNGGELPNEEIVVTNYHRLNHLSPDDFQGVVCDESSILKAFDGRLRSEITAFMRKVPHRLLCTATASPNDYIELGTSSEALGEMGSADVISKFFKKSGSFTSLKDERRSGAYSFRGHAERDFWRWVCSWARAIRKPSDLGFSDDGYDLPPLTITEHEVKASRPRPGLLFDLAATNLHEQREERRRTLPERCAKAAELVNDRTDASVVWCHLNDEGDQLTRLIDGAVQVSGSDSDDRKEQVFEDFSAGKIKALVTKPVIAGFGLNWQHCAHQTFFPSHSYEQWYQAVRRSWRFGQTREVEVDVIASEGESKVIASLQRKSEQADQMFQNLIELMGRELRVTIDRNYNNKTEVPSWL